MGRRLLLPGFPAMWAIEEIWLQTAAKDALDDDISGKLIPFSDLKSRVNRYVLEIWQSEWKEFPENKLHKIISKLKGLHNLSSDKQEKRL